MSQPDFLLASLRAVHDPGLTTRELSARLRLLSGPEDEAVAVAVWLMAIAGPEALAAIAEKVAARGEELLLQTPAV